MSAPQTKPLPQFRVTVRNRHREIVSDRIVNGGSSFDHAVAAMQRAGIGAAVRVERVEVWQ